MFKLKKEFNISCSHRLFDMDASDETNSIIFGRCCKNHGHNYKIILYLKSDSLKHGMLLNFNEIKDIFNLHIDNVYDHKFLNDCPGFENVIPTAENMCKVFFNKLKVHLSTLYAVEIYETEGASAIYEDD